MRIILASEKHGQRLLDASAPEQFASSALALLSERDAEGYWYTDPADLVDREDAALLAMTDEQIDALPERIATSTRRARASARSRTRDIEDEQEWWTRMREVVDGQDLACNRAGRPIAWVLLSARAEHEYERVELVDVEQP